MIPETISLPLRSVLDIQRDASRVLLPPRRVKPWEAAASSLSNHRGKFDTELAPMMREPVDVMASRRYTGVVFVGPARSGKTFSIVMGGLAYIITESPGDTLITHISADAGRDFSRSELDPVLRNSPQLQARMSPRARDDNTYDKFFRSGMVVKIGWPAVSQLSSKTLKYVFLTDYDRPENRDDVDGEGPMWDLAFKRIETYMSRGKCVAESSPGEDMVDRNWKQSSAHEGPPVLGIMSLYNRGTRARWYWRCVHCGSHFQAQPGLANFELPGFDKLCEIVVGTDLMGYAEDHAKIACPACGGIHEMQERGELNTGAAWIHEGQAFNAQGEIVGDRRRTQIASYWLGGVAAAYQRWDSLIHKYLQGVQTYVTTADEGAMRTTTTLDQAMPYLPRSIAKRRSIDEYRERLEDWPKGMIPEGVRFLIGTVDVQQNYFMIHVYGWGVELECWIIDRFKITASNRMEDGDRNAALAPASYGEDWDVLIDSVIDRAYPVDGLEAVTMPMQLTVCDSGGAAGVTQKAYEFWRKMRNEGRRQRFALVKGNPSSLAARTQESWPDTRGQKHDSGARGDVPVWLINTTLMKDAIVGNLAREKPGPGYVHIPRWIDSAFFEEITAEERSAKGWENPKKKRNEAFDLHYYARAACILVGAERINWSNPPSWARVPAREPSKASVISIEELARSLNA